MQASLHRTMAAGLIAFAACSETGLSPEPDVRAPTAGPSWNHVVPDVDPMPTSNSRLGLIAERWNSATPCSRRSFGGSTISSEECPSPDGDEPYAEARERWRVPGRSSHSYIAPPDPAGVFPTESSSIFADFIRRRFVSGRDGTMWDGSHILPPYSGWPTIHEGHGLVLQAGHWETFYRVDGTLIGSGHEPVEADVTHVSLLRRSPGAVRLIDLDSDGHLEAIIGRRIYSIDGTLLAEIDVDLLPNDHAFIDADQDGNIDIVSGAGTFNVHGHAICEVDVETIRGEVEGPAIPIELGEGGSATVVVGPPDRWPAVDDGGLFRLQSAMCEVIVERALDGFEYDPGSVRQVLSAGRYLRSGGQQLVVEGMVDHTPRRFLYDSRLNFVKELKNVATSQFLSVDLNGDGRLEIVAHVRYSDELPHGTREAALVAHDLESGREQVLNRDTHATNPCMAADADGDGHIELYCFEYRDGNRYLISYEGADGPWASGYRFYWPYFEGYLFTPDGYPNSRPVDFSELGGFNYLPSADPWYGRNSDLIVRIADVCDEECEDGWMVAWVQIGNQGRVGVSRPVVAQLYGERDGVETLVAEVRRDTAPKGWWSAAEPLRFPAAGYDRLRAVVHGDDWEVEECDTSNNEDVWELTCG